MDEIIKTECQVLEEAIGQLQSREEGSVYGLPSFNVGDKQDQEIDPGRDVEEEDGGGEGNSDHRSVGEKVPVRVYLKVFRVGFLTSRDT